MLLLRYKDSRLGRGVLTEQKTYDNYSYKEVLWSLRHLLRCSKVNSMLQIQPPDFISQMS